MLQNMGNNILFKCLKDVLTFPSRTQFLQDDTYDFEKVTFPPGFTGCVNGLSIALLVVDVIRSIWETTRMKLSILETQICKDEPKPAIIRRVMTISVESFKLVRR